MSNLLSRLFSKKAETPEEKLGQKLMKEMQSLKPSLQTIKDLVAQGAPINFRGKFTFTALHFACRDAPHNLDTIKFLVDAGADVNIKALDKGDVYTPLFLAAYNNREKVVEWLIEKGAVIDEPTWKGKTALYWARRQGHDDVAGMLEKAAEDAKMRDLKQKQAQQKHTGLRL